MIIDSHCHIHDEKFSEDLNEILKRSKEANISHLVTIGCDLPTIKSAASIADNVANVYFSAGFHPHEAKFLTDDALVELKQYASREKCVAIGECGLDYYYHHSSVEEQKQAFEKQLQLASDINLPVIIHLRDAFADCVAILKKYMPRLKDIVLHCFSGTLDEAKTFESMGCHISLSGIVTFKKPGELLEVAKEIALDRLLIETDCPWLAPHPFRGTRNEPALIVYTLDAVAKVRSEARDVVEEQIHKNSMRFFGLG